MNAWNSSTPPTSDASPASAGPARGRSLHARQILGYAVALACLVWVFHGVDAGKFWRSMTTIRWEWIALAVIFDILAYTCQGLRWQLLLRPVGSISSVRTTQAIYAGLFTNEIMPMRLGELVRAYLVSRWLKVDMVRIISSMAVERLFDGIWLVLAIGIAACYVHLPQDMLRGEEILAVLVFLLASLFIYAVFGRRRARERKGATTSTRLGKLVRLLEETVERLVEEARSIGISRASYVAMFVSLLLLVFQMVSFWLVMWGYGLRLSFWVGAVVLLVVHVGTMIPNAPSNVGTYQFFTVVGLALFGIDRTLATGFSVVVFVVLTVPLWALGLLAIGRSGMTLSAIRQEITRSVTR